jgi:hypothetical protein
LLGQAGFGEDREEDRDGIERVLGTIRIGP